MTPGHYKHSDELIDELDSTLMMFGRMIAMRHADEECAHKLLDGPRLVLLHLLAGQGALKAGDLAQQLAIKAPATTALLDALETDGYISRERSAEDRRVTVVRATDKGLAALHEAEARRREHMRRYLSVISEDDIRTMIRIQRTLMDAFTAEQA